MHYNILIYLHSFVSSLFLDDSSVDISINYQSDISSRVTGNLNVSQNQEVKCHFSPQVTSLRLHLLSFLKQKLVSYLTYSHFFTYIDSELPSSYKYYTVNFLKFTTLFSCYHHLDPITIFPWITVASLLICPPLSFPSLL